MATKVYDISYVKTIDGKEFEITPLKIKYMRQFMDMLDNNTYIDKTDMMIDLVTVCMKQYAPEIANKDAIEDIFDIHAIIEILDAATGMKFGESNEENDKEDISDATSENSWNKLDLAKLETEVFLLGVYKDYDELESCLSLNEVITIINGKRELDYEEKKFLASIQGIELEGAKKEEDPWEAMKARVFSGGKATSANDIMAYQGLNASRVGFGIGMGLDYVDMTKKKNTTESD